jgi:alkylation response protein AidB-like acyl-CoA dehydrogenase
MEAAERTLLAETVRAAVARAPADADAALDGLGWLEMLDAEPDDALAIVFGALGAVNANATVLDDVFVAALGLEPRHSLAALLPGWATWEPPNRHGLATARVRAADEIVVVDAGLCVAIVPTSSVSLSRVEGVDPDAGFYVVEVAVDAASGVALERDVWDFAIARARRAVAHQIAGATRAMLDLARLHALERVQFGRPVARFQAVRHRLADALIAIESLEAALTAAADAPGRETAALAKAVAGRSARTVVTQCQQVLAGIGFTTDHPFHGLLKRTLLLDGLLGAADDLLVAIGRQLLDTRAVPTLIEL